MDRLRTDKGFTLVEMVVAVGILAVMVSFAGVVFKSGIEANRAAAANAEIMQKLRAITEQLNADFRGLRKDVNSLPLSVGQEDTDFGTAVQTVASDAIAFFADGDFQSTQLYGGAPVSGNVAAIFYGLVDPGSYPTMPAKPPKPQEKILARRQTIFTYDTTYNAVPWNDLVTETPREFYYGSLSQLDARMKTDAAFRTGVLVNLIKRPPVTASNLSEDDLTVFMAKGVDNFTIEYVKAGVLDFTAPNIWLRTGSQDIRPVAFKFTFTLYDSHGIIKNGRTFTHIVYLDS